MTVEAGEFTVSYTNRAQKKKGLPLFDDFEYRMEKLQRKRRNSDADSESRRHSCEHQRIALQMLVTEAIRYNQCLAQQRRPHNVFHKSWVKGLRRDFDSMLSEKAVENLPSFKIVERMERTRCATIELALFRTIGQVQVRTLPVTGHQ